MQTIPHRMRFWPAAILLLAGAGVLLASQRSGAPAAPAAAAPAIADTGILTSWPLPLDRGPWQLKWDDVRNLIWFAEGNHATNTRDAVGAIDPATNVLREWAIPTMGGYVHGTYIDRNGNIWFTEARINKIGRLQPATNTITEWTLDPSVGGVHGITVDDSITGTVTVWFTERDQDVIGSLDPATGHYFRHQHPFSNSKPHSVVVAADHSVWFVDTCGNRAGQLIPGSPDVWNLWPSPTAVQCGPPEGIGPLFGRFIGADFWYSEGFNDNLLRLQPGSNTLSIWHVPGSTRLLTQIGADPDNNVFVSEMTGNKIARLEPVGPTTPTVVAVVPTHISQAAPPQITAVPASVVYTPVVTQLTPEVNVLNGTRTGSLVEWPLPTPVTPVAGRFVGPARSWYGGGGFWVSEVSVDRVSRFAPFTATPGPPTPSATATRTPVPPSVTRTPGPPSATPTSTNTPNPLTPSPTPCLLQFSDVSVGSPFYTYVRCLACRGIVGGYTSNPPCTTGTPCFLPGNNVTRGQMSKFVANAAGYTDAIPSTQQTFSDVPYGSPFWLYVERAVAHNVISGYSSSPPCVVVPCFLPSNPVTRGQTAKFVSNAAGYGDTIPSTRQTFADVPYTNAFWIYTERVYAHGVISGYTGDGLTVNPCTGTVEQVGQLYFRPCNVVTRGQTSKFIANAFFPNCQTPQTR